MCSPESWADFHPFHSHARKGASRSLPPGIPAGCASGGDGCFYRFHGEQKNWTEAQNICKEDGGNLPIIFNETTRDALRGFMDDGWIGATDQWEEGTRQTPAGESIPYKSWAEQEPNNDGDEDCAVQRHDKTWSDIPCGRKKPFCCQFIAGNVIQCALCILVQQCD